MLLLSLPLLALLPVSVSAHGFVHKVWIGDKTFLGNTPQAEPTPSIVRQISEVDPVKGATNPFVNCGQNAQLAEQVADANPGDSMSFLWTGGDLSTWPHNIGPMLTYMTNCGDDCTTFNSSAAKWFKIDEVGRIPGDKQGTWFQNRIFAQAGIPANVTLPSTLAPGNYLIRHEIIALHLATEKGGAEFYPSCTQLRVGGSGTGAPTADELVELPGAYSDTDPGIFVPDVFNTPPEDYTFPGPPVAAFVGASSGSGSGAPSASKSASASAPSTTGSSSSSGSKGGKSCKLKRASPSSSSKKRSVDACPHKVSRIMRPICRGP
ncbi:glycoside hydrolase family 61 protein [Mycena amicta]|nr:glycoside hydrolase family 61 protein [Mycena amicta]